MTAELKQLPNMVQVANDRIAADLREKVEEQIAGGGGALSGFAVVTWDKDATTQFAVNNSGPCMLPQRLLPAFVEEAVRGYLVRRDIEIANEIPVDGAS